jgi:hypothetical protein
MPALVNLNLLPLVHPRRDVPARNWITTDFNTSFVTSAVKNCGEAALANYLLEREY